MGRNLDDVLKGLPKERQERIAARTQQLLDAANTGPAGPMGAQGAEGPEGKRGPPGKPASNSISVLCVVVALLIVLMDKLYAGIVALLHLSNG